ncbi:MAG: pilus assembly protein TadG-related protein [Blastocatellia bacterium]
MKRIFSLPDSIRNFPHRRQTRQQRGSIMVLTTVVIVGMTGMLALAVDLGYLFGAQTQLQNAVNAAALAAGAGLRVTIESDLSAPEQKNIAKSLANIYGGKNVVRRFKEAGQPGADNFAIGDVTVAVDPATGIPSVEVKASAPTQMLFAGAFGLNSVNLGAKATASLLPVDGGTGTILSGTNDGGCWRPLFLPDTFYNSTNMAQIVGDVSLGGAPRVPTDAGDYYRSRFAAGARNTFPFVDAFSSAGSNITGLRDTQLHAEVDQRQSIMGQLQNVTFHRNFYFIADFSGLPRDRLDVLSAADTAFFGYCGKIRVGDDIPVYPRSDTATYEAVRERLRPKSQAVFADTVFSVEESLFRYVTSSSYADPNTHISIIPVLLYNPIIWKDDATANSTTMLRVTNIGLFFLKTVTQEGDLQGYFVREIITGGIPIDPANMGIESDSFRRRWLPMSVQLVPNKQ